MSKKIVIIGAGQLGSRHLQGIAQSTFDISIEVLEPFESSRKIAEERYYQIKNRGNVVDINFYDSILKLSNEIDLCIVATGSDVRFKIIQELLDSKNVKNIILEKVLFQSIKEYYDTEKLLEKTQTLCWVNHPRRMYPFYKKLKSYLQNAKQISYCFHGGAWGLGCNGLHFIDHLAYIANATGLQLSNEFLNNEIYNSKRKGYLEFNGLLSGKIANHSFSLYSNENVVPSMLTISSDIIVLKIDETAGKILISKKENDWMWEEINEKIIYFQSELSQIFLNDILINNTCSLPSYKESMSLHIPFIECLLNQMEKVKNKKYTICPIT